MVEMAEKFKNREDQEERDLKKYLKFLSLKVTTLIMNHGEHMKFLVFYTGSEVVYKNGSHGLYILSLQTPGIDISSAVMKLWFAL